MEADSGQQDACKQVAGVGAAPVVPSGPREAPRLPAAPLRPLILGTSPPPPPSFPHLPVQCHRCQLSRWQLWISTHGLWALPCEFVSYCKRTWPSCPTESLRKPHCTSRSWGGGVSELDTSCPCPWMNQGHPGWGLRVLRFPVMLRIMTFSWAEMLAKASYE